MRVVGPQPKYPPELFDAAYAQSVLSQLRGAPVKTGTIRKNLTSVANSNTSSINTHYLRQKA